MSVEEIMQKKVVNMPLNMVNLIILFIFNFQSEEITKEGVSRKVIKINDSNTGKLSQKNIFEHFSVKDCTF